MQRRHLVTSLAGLSIAPSTSLLTSCRIMKKDIRKFGKMFEYLKDDVARTRETGDALMVVEGASFGGSAFHKQVWRNLKFVDCSFEGGYQIRLDAMVNVEFRNCHFSGVLEFGVMTNVRFLRCHSEGNSNWGGQQGSSNVVFDKCRFIGSNSDRNRQGAIGTYGEATFLDCVIKWFDISADTGLVARGCDFDDVSYHPESAAVLIENCKLRGTFNMVPARLSSLTIRDTVVDHLDLNRADVTGDILIERVRGRSLLALIAGGTRITVRDSQFRIGPQAHSPFRLASTDTLHALIDNVQISGGSKPVELGFGTVGMASKGIAPKVNQTFTLRNSHIDHLDATYLRSAHVRFEGNEFGRLELQHSRIGTLELLGNTIVRTVDFTNVEADDAKVQPLGAGQARLEGSNIRLD